MRMKEQFTQNGLEWVALDCPVPHQLRDLISKVNHSLEFVVSIAISEKPRCNTHAPFLFPDRRPFNSVSNTSVRSDKVSSFA